MCVFLHLHDDCRVGEVNRIWEEEGRRRGGDGRLADGFPRGLIGKKPELVCVGVK